METDSLPEEWSDLRTRFRTHLSVERSYSDATITSYLQDLDDWFEHLFHHDADPWSATSEVARNYLRSLREAQGATATIQRRLSSLRRFYQFLASQEEDAGDPFRDLQAPTGSQSMVDALDEYEVDRLLEQPDRDKTIGLRDAALLEVLYGMGLRATEASTLELADIRWERSEVQVVGKGNRQRVVPMGRSARETLEQYLEESRPSMEPGHKKVFCTQRGTVLDRKQIWTIVRQRAKEAGLSEVSPHTLRHSFASHMLQRGADLRSIQEMLGHKDVSTTADIYVHLRDELQESHERFHPRGQSSEGG